MKAVTLVMLMLLLVACGEEKQVVTEAQCAIRVQNAKVEASRKAVATTEKNQRDFCIALTATAIEAACKKEE
jgi:hypothetical protein